LGVLISFTGCDDPETIVSEPVDRTPHSISGLVCIIDYAGETRLITGRRFDLIGDQAYVGAICHSAGGYRQFRCDRISAVMDAYSGEVLGNGSYFDRFDVDSRRDKAPTWGLTPGRKRLLVSGLNILAFMARCDGRWHPLETGPIERFVCSLWLRKEWPGDPPIGEILAHAQRLAPDSDVFFRSLTPFASSRTSVALLRRAVAELIEADGQVCRSEFDWAGEFDEALVQAVEVATPDFVEMLQAQGVLD
jgi:hypothetical protein